jgi:hypothetical protein
MYHIQFYQPTYIHPTKAPPHLEKVIPLKQNVSGGVHVRVSFTGFWFCGY